MAINLDLGFNLAGALLIIGILAFIAVIYYIDFLRKKSEPQSRPSVIMKTIVISFTIISILMIIFYLSGEKPNKWHYMGMIMLVMIIYWASYAESQKFMIKSKNQIIQKGWDDLWDSHHANSLTDSRFGLSLPKYKLTEIKGGKFFDLEANMICWTDLGPFLIKINPFDLNITELVHNPVSARIEEIFDKETARIYDEEKVAFTETMQEAKKYGTQKENSL